MPGSPCHAGLDCGMPCGTSPSKVALPGPYQRVLNLKTVAGADLWIDDISVDVESGSAALAARNAFHISRRS